jgi:hypothetical protein
MAKKRKQPVVYTACTACRRDIPSGSPEAKLGLCARQGCIWARNTLDESVPWKDAPGLSGASNIDKPIREFSKSDDIETSAGIKKVIGDDKDPDKEPDTAVERAAEEKHDEKEAALEKQQRSRRGKTRKKRVAVVSAALPVLFDKNKQPRYLKSVAQAAIPSADPDAPYGRDADYRAIGMPVGPTVDEAAAGRASQRIETCVHGDPPLSCPLCQPREMAPSPAHPADVAEYEKRIRLKEHQDHLAHIGAWVKGAYAESAATGKGVSLTAWERAMPNVKSVIDEKLPEPIKPRPPLESYRELFQFSRQDIANIFFLFVDTKEIVVDGARTLIPAAAVEEKLAAVEEALAKVEDDRKTRYVVWWRRNHPEEIPPSKSAMEKLRREDEREIKKLKNERRILQEKLRTWTEDPTNYVVEKKFEKVEVDFHDKYAQDLPRRFYTLDVEWEPEGERNPSDGVGYTIGNYVNVETPEPGDYSFSNYILSLHLDPAIHTAPGHMSWANWTKWENEVLLLAIKCGKVFANEHVARRYPFLKSCLSEPTGLEPAHYGDDEDDSRDGEIRLIKKTGGAHLGGASIYGRGCRGSRHRMLEDFTATLAAGGYRSGAEGSGSFYGDLDSGDVSERSGDE